MLHVRNIPAFDDNYIWLIEEDNGRAAVVDPGDAKPVLSCLQKTGQQLAAILITHNHYDHVGGIAELKAEFPEVVIFGPANESVKGLDYPVQTGDDITIPLMGFKPEVMDVPGHTRGHIAYYGQGALFCGDTLFSGGCGRVFSGTFQQLHHSLVKISNLPITTEIYCAHEYTLDNLGFAQLVEPENRSLIEREKQVRALRQQGLPTIPSELAIELATNPFLRMGIPQVIAAAESHAGHSLESSEAVFTELRQWKDRDYD